MHNYQLVFRIKNKGRKKIWGLSKAIEREPLRREEAFREGIGSRELGEWIGRGPKRGPFEALQRKCGGNLGGSVGLRSHGTVNEHNVPYASPRSTQPTPRPARLRPMPEEVADGFQ